jgi:lipid-A-disaccharide synthase-like uncharacterized protein
MNTPVAYLFDVVITPWKLVGYLGVFLFAGRWLVQMAATRRHGRPAFPGLFWIMSVLGSVLLLAYFIWGKNDSVGVLSNLFPVTVAFYNLVMHYRYEARSDADDAPSHVRTTARSLIAGWNRPGQTARYRSIHPGS